MQSTVSSSLSYHWLCSCSWCPNSIFYHILPGHPNILGDICSTVRSRSVCSTYARLLSSALEGHSSHTQQVQSLWPWHNQDSEYSVLALEVHPGSSQALITPITTPSNEGPSKTRDTSSTEALGLQPHPKGKHSRNLCLKATGLEQHSSRFLSIRAQNFCQPRKHFPGLGSWDRGLGTGLCLLGCSVPD